MKGVIEREENVASSKELAEFAKFLSVEIENDPEFREHFLSDAMEGLAAWINERPDEIPDQPDWKFVARLLSAALFYN